jgi:hypothetical protein
MGKPRTSSNPPKVGIFGPHLYTGALEVSEIPDEWKRTFKKVLKTREDVLAAIPGRHGITDMRTFRNLKMRQGPLLDVVQRLMRQVKTQVPDADWLKYGDAFNKLASYEFMMGAELPGEASSWVFEMHSLISEMYRLIDKSLGNPRLSTLARIARQVAAMPSPVNLTRKDHVKVPDVNSSSLSPEMKRAFKDALEAKSDFQSYSMDLLTNPSALKGLKFAKNSVMENMRKILEMARDAEGFDKEKFDKAALSLASYDLTSNIAETNVWSSYAHELITAMFENLTAEKKNASRLVKIAARIAHNFLHLDRPHMSLYVLTTSL